MSNMFIKIVKALFNKEEFCWRSGNKGYWYEQIDGPDNKVKVYCECKVCNIENTK
ncbi:hypothetical protein LCGC14_3119760 [marine sediment metagenome]|uniref:Uncharacterized protein n=1 Tax=marine sediment metagenome TaxID=412755 RepID=A0A0F8W2L2_9ZZZZ